MKQNLKDPAIQPIAERIAWAATIVHQQQTGQEAESVRVVVSGKTITVTLDGILSPAEQMMAQSAEGAARVQDFHRKLSLRASGALRRQIERITGLDAQEAAADTEPTVGTFVQPSTAGTIVQLFLLSQAVPSATFDQKAQTDAGSIPNRGTPLAAA